MPLGLDPADGERIPAEYRLEKPTLWSVFCCQAGHLSLPVGGCTFAELGSAALTPGFRALSITRVAGETVNPAMADAALALACQGVTGDHAVWV